MFKRYLIAFLDRIIPNIEVEELKFGTGGAFQFFTMTSRRASAKVRPHELGHIVQQWTCSFVVGIYCYLYGMDPFLVLGFALVLGYPLWAVIYVVDILCRTFENKIEHHYKWKPCLYVGYKNSLFERQCRKFAGQDEKHWLSEYYRKYGR